MYRYDTIDHAIVTGPRCAVSRPDATLSGRRTERKTSFARCACKTDCTSQRHGPMLRIAVPYGLLSAAQLRTLADISRRYDRGVGHFTTRHNPAAELGSSWRRCRISSPIWPKVELHAIQTSGNCIRNVTTDHFAGVAADEIADPRPWARNAAAVVELSSRNSPTCRASSRVAVSGCGRRSCRDSGARSRVCNW